MKMQAETNITNGINNFTYCNKTSTMEQNNFGDVFLLVIGVGTGFGFLYHRYYQVNDAETIRLWHHHPHISSLFHKLYIIPKDIYDKVRSVLSKPISQYSQYDYQLYIARLAASILNDPNHAISDISGFLSLLQDVCDSLLFVLISSGLISDHQRLTHLWSLTTLLFSPFSLPFIRQRITMRSM